MYKIWIFFFKWYGDPRILPSSPTQRSSDLLVDVDSPPAGLDPDRLEADSLDARFPARRDNDHLAARLGAVVHPRSEEHTSELQSRQYLVCRLLLEKKTYTLSLTSLPFFASS